MKFAIRLYRWLAQAFPHEFKMAYGADMDRLGEDVVPEIAKRSGLLGLLRLVADAAVRIPVEYLSEMRRDLAYALRTITNAPGFALTAILSLGLGMSVASLAYSMVYGLLFRELPLVKQPQRLVTTDSSYPCFEQYRNQRDVVSCATAYMPGVPFSVSLSATSGAMAERISGQIVSPEYFQVLGLSAEHGRVFSPDVDKPGQTPIVIISSGFWHRHFNSDPGVVGRTLRLNGQTATIVGVAPENFVGTMPITPSDLFVPTTLSPKIAPELGQDLLHNRDVKAFVVLMRLAPGVTLASAEAALDIVTKRLDESSLDPDRNRKGRRLRLSEGGVMNPSTPEIRAVFYGVFGVLVGLLLSIACMNLASMLLARAGARQREIAIRLAVGASRFRLIRQLLTECILLAIGGGVVGIVLAYWMTRGISSMKFPGLAGIHYDVHPDWHVIAFTFVLSIITGIGFGLAPAFAATRTGIASTIKQGFLARMRGYKRFGMRNVVIALQVSGSVMLLLITLALSIGGRKLWSFDASFDIRTMHLMVLDPMRDGYSPEQTAAFFEKLPGRLRNVAAVEASALAATAPFDGDLGGGLSQSYSAISEPRASQTTLSRASRQAVGSGYFAALNESVLTGREFTDRDQRIDPSSGSMLPIILNRAAAKELFGDANPIGRRILQPPRTYEVVGTVRDLPTMMSRVQPIVYTPITMDTITHPSGNGLTLVLRSSIGTDALKAVRQEIASIDPNLTIFNVRTLSQSIDDVKSLRQVSIFIYATMGLFGLILASVGLAGVTAFAVTQRRKEIGIRMALGAQKSQVIRLLLREGAALMVIGSALGLCGASLVGRALSATLYGFARAFNASARDPRLIVGVPLLLTGLVMLSCFLPARKATQIDPLQALREE
jgi:predicted permease